MQVIANTEIDSSLDFDYGEGWVAFSWLDGDGIRRSLTINADGHCSREMPIRSGVGVEIPEVTGDRVRLSFTNKLASRLELSEDIVFMGCHSALQNQPLIGASKPATMWGVLDGRILLFGPVGKGS